MRRGTTRNRDEEVEIYIGYWPEKPFYLIFTKAHVNLQEILIKTYGVSD